MSEEKFQKAVVVGKVTLPPPRKEVQVKPKAPPPPPKREDRPKRMKHFGDRRPQVEANQAMLQELQYIKGQLKTEKETTASLKMKLHAVSDAETELVNLIDELQQKGALSEETATALIVKLEQLKESRL